MKITTDYQNNSATYTPVLSQTDYLMKASEMILEHIGEDLKREGLQRTPKRFAKAYAEICSGYNTTAREVVGEGVFQGEGGLVSVRDIEFFSLCEHHMLPFLGKVSIAYLPKDKILGLSKLPRIVDVFAKRLQVQERLTKEIAEGIDEVVSPKAVVVRIKASHMCMMMRGVKRTGSETVTEFSIGIDALSEIEQKRLWKSID